ncbi:MAG: glycosyltransferase involved in cell wall biosynthesis [Francisellaceae bacterium]|jgi:glycosyltransferase involved in cell wall biosynthesis
MINKVLMVHQGAELYGSDRSFLSIVCYFKKNFSGLNKVILPYEGELSRCMRDAGVDPFFHNSGILRKKDVKKPFTFLMNLVRSIKFYSNEYKDVDVIYINTVVMLSALITAVFYKNKEIICHVREIPSKNQMWLFKLLLKASRSKLIYNSVATKKAFNIVGDVIYNGVAAGNSLDIDNDLALKTNFLIIGRINDWKGQDLLLQAVTKLELDVRGRIQIRIVGGTFGGDNSTLDELHRLVKQNQLSDVVSFYDFADDPSEHYVWADWTVVPSKRPEPFGRVAVESFAFSKPVIAANHGGLTEIITDQENGYLFAPNSCDDLAAILQLSSRQSKSEFDQFCVAAQTEYTQRFSESSYQLKLYESILSI